MKYLMALDAGTGSIRSVIFDENGQQIAVAQTEWTHLEDPRFPNSMNFDYHKNWDLCRNCIRQALQKSNIDPADLCAISTTCMREGIIIYNKNGEEIWACANVDARSEEVAAKLVLDNPELQKAVYKSSGQTYALSAIPRLLFIKEKQPEIYQQMAKIGMFNDWMIYKLTGQLIIEPSNGSTLGLINLQTRQWDYDIIKKFGIPTNCLPEIKEPGTVVGNIKADLAHDLGLDVNTKVIIGGGDAQLGCLGVGACKVGSAIVLGGSFWQYEYNTNSAHTDSDAKIRMNCYITPNLWQYEAIAFQPGMILKWFKNAFAFPFEALAKQNNESIYSYLENGAVKVPAGSNGMLGIFSDEMNFIAWRHAACSFIDFKADAAKYNIFTFYRALLENACMVTRGHINAVASLTGQKPNELIFANGASQSDLCCQILADVTNIPVKRPIVKEATALGAAILACYGCGLYNDLNACCEHLVQFEKTFYPQTENIKTYDKLYSKWRKVYATELDLSDKGITNYMWCAPGANQAINQNS